VEAKTFRAERPKPVKQERCPYWLHRPGICCKPACAERRECRLRPDPRIARGL